MTWGKRGPGSPSRRREAFRPVNEPLEDRRLLTTFDLTTTQTAPLGVQFVGKASNNIAGFTVTDVGNVTGSGYDSFVISAPGLAVPVGGTPVPSAAGEGAAYLVFGSKQVNLSSVANYLTLANGTTNGTTTALTGGKRAGDLGELGTLGVAAQSGVTTPTAQTNPTVAQPQPPQSTTHVYGFNFDGLTLVTGLDTTTGLGRNSALGFSVSPLGDINGDGYDDFALGAPNDAGGGKVFVVFGGPNLANQAVSAKTVDLEATVGTTNPSAPTKVLSLSLSTGTAGTDVGYAVSGIGNYFNVGNGRDLAIGVPGLTVGANANAGAVFAVSGNYLSTLPSGTNIDLTTVGNGSNTSAGIEYTGTAAGARTGASVSTAGNFDGATGTAKAQRDSLLIGAPGAFIGGGAYLVYSLQSYLPNMQVGTTQSLATLGVAATTNPVTNPLQGVVLGDTTLGDRLGYSVSSAGDYNNDGADDIVLGAPGYLFSTGYADVIYGASGTTTTRINGIFSVNPVSATTGLTSVAYVGEAINDYAGYSLSTTTHIVIGSSTSTTATPGYDILIGSPGNQTAYLIPGTATGATASTGSKLLANTNTSLNGSEFVVNGLSDPAIVSAGFGSSVNARNPVYDADPNSTTVDGDGVPDLFFGAPLSSLTDPVTSLTVTRSLAGVAYVVEGGLIGTSSNTGGTTGGTSASGAAANLQGTFVTLNQPTVFTGLDAGLPYPAVDSLSHLTSYAPLPVQLAYQQYMVQPGFLDREQVANHPSQKNRAHQAPAGTVLNVAAIGHSENKYDKKRTLSPRIFDRGKLKVGKSSTFTHKVKVIPKNLQTEHYPG